MGVTPVCAYVAGGDFRTDHALALASQVPGLVCLSSTPVPFVRTIAPKVQWPHWWCKMAAYDTDLIPGDILLMDLDTVVLQMPQMPTKTTVLNDFTRPGCIGSGFVYITEADRKRVYEVWMQDPSSHMARCTTRDAWGDQGFLEPLLPDAGRWGSNIVSYKRHCLHGIPFGTDVVCFHGVPRPWDTVRFGQLYR